MLNRFCLIVALAIGCAGRAAVPADSEVTVAGLRCENLHEPLGIDSARPRLGWTLASSRRGQRQSAYQIVARSAGKVVWDSGRVESDHQTHVPWGGTTLLSGQRVDWRVRVWDGAGRMSALSEPGTFEMGLLRPEDWHGKWIGGAAALRTPPAKWPLPDKTARWIAGPDGGPQETTVETSFTVPEGRVVKTARAVFAGGGPFAVLLNGREVLREGGGPVWLHPAEVSTAIQPGSNRLAVRVAAAGVLGRLVVELDQGPAISVATGAAWMGAREVSAPAPGRMKLAPDAAPAPLLRRSFTIDRPVRWARLHIAAAGYAEPVLDGVKVGGDRVLDPGFTRFDRRVVYVTHDVTGALQPGKHVVGLVLGNGFYNQHAQDAWDFQVAPWRGPPRALVELRVGHDDGTVTRISSDGSWQAADGPIVFDGIRNGERYDARLERRGWSTPGGDPAGWRPASVLPAPGGVVSAQVFPPVRVTETLRPVRITPGRPGTHLVDFGQNVVGWARLRVAGPAGTRVTMRYAEKLTKQGTLDQGNIDGLVFQGPFQTDEYVLSGKGIEVWEPRFTYHGFQYLEVTGWPGPLDVKDAAGTVEARVVNTDFGQVGDFASSDETLNQIWRATLRSFRGNFVSVPTDCPHREKNGWMADAHLATEAGLYAFDAASAYEKWLRDIRDEQRPTGELPGIVPTGGWGYQWGNGPAWDSALFLVPWYLYLYTGDPRPLVESYPSFVRYLGHVETRDYWTKNPSGWLGDWVSLEDKTPEALTHAGYHLEDARIAAIAARLAGKPDEAARWERMAAGVRQKFAATFHDPATGGVRPETQTGLAAAAYQGLLVGDERNRVLARLVANIEGRGRKLNTGVLGAKYLPWALTEAGRPDLFHTIAVRPEFPSWGNWLAQGATTLWEDWQGGSSRNHIFFGDISAWLFRALVGIGPDPESPGFAHVVVRPHPIPQLSWARARTRTGRGEVAAEWRREAGVLTLRVTVPVNSRATVFVPAADRRQVTDDGATFVRADRDRQVYAIGSGAYAFVVRK